MRVVVDKDEQGRDKLGFQFLDGPVTPKPEQKLPAARPQRLSGVLRRVPNPKRGLGAEKPLAKAPASHEQHLQGWALRLAFVFCRCRMPCDGSCGRLYAMRQVWRASMPAPMSFSPSAACLCRWRKIGALLSVFSLVLMGTYIGMGALAHDVGASSLWLALSTILAWAAPAQLDHDIRTLEAVGTLQFEVALAVTLSATRLFPMVVA